MGERGAGELSDYIVPGVNVSVGHVEEDSERVRRELAESGIHEKELGAENDIVEERGAEEASV